MVVPILCLVCLCLLMWVMLLKTEIARLNLKYQDKDELTRPSRVAAQKGMKSFKIG